MFVDNHDISDMFEEHFVLKKKNSQLPISRLMETAKVKVGDFGKKFTEKRQRTLEIFFFVSVNNSFSLYVLHLENFLRIYVNLVSPINELRIENYLSECGSKDSINVKRVKEKIAKRVFDCVVDVGKNIKSYFNVVLETVLLLNIFFNL